MYDNKFLFVRKAVEVENFAFVVSESVAGFTVNNSMVSVFAFVGITESGEAKYLNTMFYAGFVEEIPWKDIIPEILDFGNISNLVMSDSGNAIKNILAELAPDVNFYSEIYNVPSDTPFKSEAQSVKNILYSDLRSFWRFKNVKTLAEADKEAEKFAELITGKIAK